jgi:hypothetical protein
MEFSRYTRAFSRLTTVPASDLEADLVRLAEAGVAQDVGAGLAQRQLDVEGAVVLDPTSARALRTM